MKLWLLAFMLVVLVFAGCSPSQATIDTAIPLTRQATLSDSPIPPSPTPTLPTAPASRSPVGQKSICQPNMSNQLSDLELPNNYLVLVNESVQSRKLYYLSSLVKTEKPVAEPLWPMQYLAASPSGKRIAFLASQKTSGQYYLWMSSATGLDAFPVQPATVTTLARWVSNNVVMLLDTDPTKRRGNSQPIGLLDADTGKYKALGSAPGDSYVFAWLPDGPLGQTIYYDHRTKKWYAFDHSSEITEPLSWLSGYSETPSHGLREILTGTIIRPSAFGVQVAITREYGLDIARNVSIQQFTNAPRNSDVAMDTYALGNGQDLQLLWVSDNSRYVAIDHLTPIGAEPHRERLEVLNADERVLIDYCVEQADYFERFAASPDERFVAWSVSGAPGTQQPDSTIILALDTGKWIRLEGVKFEGWGDSATH